MYLLIDGCPLQTPARSRGIGRYTSGLLHGLKSVRPGWRIEVIEHGRLPPIPSELASGLPILRFEAPFAYDLNAPANYPANDRYFADWLLARNPDHLLFASVFEKLGVVPTFADRRPPTSGVMYDLIPVLFPEHYGILGDTERWYARRYRDIARMDKLFAISGAAADDARLLLAPDGPLVENIQGAVDIKFVPFPIDQVHERAARMKIKYRISKPFILCVGGEDYRKNLCGAVAGFAELPRNWRDGHQLIIACYLSEARQAEVNSTAERLGVGSQVITTGFVSDEELVLLYQTCRLCFFPSIYEGLGLPVLEALTCGAPVACSNCSSLPEFAGNVSWQFDPYNARSMADALVSSLSEPREERFPARVAFARNFTWPLTAMRVAEGIESVKPARHQRRPRLAWVSASAPSDRPHRFDSVNVLGHLARKWDLELVHPYAGNGLSTRPVLLKPEEFDSRANAAPYDVVALHVDAGGPDLMVLAVAARHSGIVILNHPDPSAYYPSTIRWLLSQAAGVVVRSSIVRHWAQSFCDVPVLLLPWSLSRQGDQSIAAWLGAVFDAAATRIGTSEKRWLDGVANALAPVAESVPADLIEQWVRLRLESVRPAA